MRRLGTPSVIALINILIFTAVIDGAGIGHTALGTLPLPTQAGIPMTASPPQTPHPSINVELAAIVPGVDPSTIQKPSSPPNTADQAPLAATTNAGGNGTSGSGGGSTDEPIEEYTGKGVGRPCGPLLVRENGDIIIKRCPAVPIALSSAPELVEPTPTPIPEVENAEERPPVTQAEKPAPPAPQQTPPPPQVLPLAVKQPTSPEKEQQPPTKPLLPAASPQEAAVQPPAASQVAVQIPKLPSQPVAEPQPQNVELQDSGPPKAKSPSQPEDEVQPPAVQIPKIPESKTPNQPEAAVQNPSTHEGNAPTQQQANAHNEDTQKAASPTQPENGEQAESPTQPQTEQEVQPGTPGNPAKSPIEQEAAPKPVITVGSSTYAYHVDASSNVVVASQTVTPGGPELSLNGVNVGLGKDAKNIVVAGKPVPVQIAHPVQNQVAVNAPFTVGNEVVTANSASQYVVHGQTLIPGAAAINVEGTPVSLGPQGFQVVVGSSMIGLQQAVETNRPVLTIGGQTIAPNSAGFYVVGGETVTPGAAPVTISGTPISVPVTNKPVLTIGGETIAPNSAGFYVVAGQTIMPGASAVTVSGTPISVPASLLPSATEGFIQLGSSALPYSLNLGGNVVIASKTLAPGGQAITVAGQTISEALNGQSVVIVSGGKTKTKPISSVLTPTGIPGFNGPFSGIASAAATGFNTSTSSFPASNIPSGFMFPTASLSGPPLPGTPSGTGSRTGGAPKIIGASLTVWLSSLVIVLLTSVFCWH
ncbi:hypothetical protein MMC21_002330 [Puttea exsequens]|nr:hypothetical protein [Puttea exsequens]